MTVIHWEGYEWTLTPSELSTSPGPCNWDDVKTWQFIRGGGLLLRTVYDGSHWRCVGLTGPPLGYGKYEWKIRTDPDGWDENIVLGLFTYADVDSGYNEIDINFSKRGDISAKNLVHFYNQPTPEVVALTTDCHESHHTCGNGNCRLPITVSMTWQSGQIHWRCTDDRGTILGEHFCPDAVPTPGTTPAPCVSMNFWYQGGGGAPVHGRADSVVLESFRFIPAEVRLPPPAAQPAFIIPASTVETFPAGPVPSDYQPPRQISTVIKPTRLNFCPNPSIEISTAGWTVIGSSVLTQDSSITPADGSYSLKTAVHAASDGCYIVIPDLVVGDTYIASAMVQGGAGLEDVLMSVSGASASSSQDGIPYGGDAILDIGYGEGPYGGVEAGTSDMPTGQWFNPSAVFTASASTVVLAFRSLVGSDVSYPTAFWVDAVLVEAGEVLNPYFDGSYGTDYSWETAGTAGLTRSYYYERMEVTTGAVNDVLSQHTPLGITAAAPVFSSPYSQ